MDHYCPWVGATIGIGNEKQFLVFNWYVFLLSTVTIVDLLVRGVVCLILDTPPG